MTRPPATSRIEKLLASMHYSSRAVIARTARSGVIALDGVALRDATVRVADIHRRTSKEVIDSQNRSSCFMVESLQLPAVK